MAPIPVLQVLYHSPWYFRDASQKMDEAAMMDDWHVRTAQALEHAMPGRFQIECWRPDWREPVETKATVNGLVCRIFPSWRAPFDKFSYEISIPMIRALWRLAKRKRFILHVHEMHSTFGALAGFLPQNGVITAHNHGTPPFGLRLIEGRSLLKRMFFSSLLPVEKASLARYHHLFAISNKELDYLKKHNLPASKLTMGVDFKSFTPRDKAEARVILGLPSTAKIVLYIGRYFRLKGVDQILDAMDSVRASLPEAFFMMVGGLPQDELFSEVTAKADRGLARVPYAQLANYIAASDLCIANVAELASAGIGMAAVEAMAMNIPVLTTSLGEFPGPEHERDQLGIYFRPGMDDLSESIKRGLLLAKNINPRKIAKKYYDWSIIAASIANVYEMAWMNSE